MRRVEGYRLATWYELAGVLTLSFSLNFIPFTGPSNLFIAYNIAIAIKVEPWIVGLLVALGSALAKFVHYIVTFFIGRFMSETWKKRVDERGTKLKRWAALALFLVAASPLPDEPVIVPLGLTRYNPAKFFLVYFVGKLTITIAGAYLGSVSQQVFSQWISDEALMVASIVLTVLATILLFKFDIGKVAERFLKRKVEL